MSDSLAYFAADTLEAVLYQTNTGLTSKDSKKITFGPWQIDLVQDAISDIITPKELSFWVKLGRIHLYLVVKEQEAFLMVLDAIVLQGLTMMTTESSLYERLRQIKPAIKTTWQYSGARWTQIKTR